MVDLSKEIVRELGLAGPHGLSLNELFCALDIIEQDLRYQEFFYNNMRKLKLGLIFTGNATQEIDTLSCEQLLRNNHYRFTVSDVQREQAVMGSFYNSQSFTEATFLILSLIAKSKSLGMTQVELSKASGQDARTVFHHLKILGTAKVIVKYPIIHDGNKTSLCIHMDFADQNSGYQKHVQLRTTNIITQEDFSYVDSGISHADLVKVKISTLLENSKTKMLATDDMFDVIQEESGDSFHRRLFNRILHQMQNAGYLEVIYVPLGEDKILRCAKLCKEFRLTKSKEYTGFEKNSDSSIKYAIKRSTDMLIDQPLLAQGTFYSDLSIEWQIFRLIYLSGSQGVTSNMLYKSLRMEGAKMMEKVLERLLKGDASKGLSVTKVLENFGREKRFRYFACKKANKHFKDELESEGKKTRSFIDLSSLQRRNNLLELLETHKVLECGVALVDMYERFLKDRGAQTGYTIDKRTLERTAKSLQDDNLLSMHIITVPQMAGSVITKTILLHKSISMKDPIVHDLIDAIQSKAFQINGISGKKVLENVNVERLKTSKRNSRVTERLSKEVPLVEVYRGDHDPNLIQFSYADTEMDEDHVNTENPSSSNWIACATKYGYVQNVLARARILHAWLFQKLANRDELQDSIEYENDGWFSLTMLTNDIEFNYYMRLVGLTTETQILQDFLKEGGYEKITTGTLPQKVREVVFSHGYVRYRREIRNILQELERHKIVTHGDNQIKGDQLYTKYRLNSEVPIPVSEESFQTCHINSLEALRNFWSKLNAIQSKIVLSEKIRTSRVKNNKKPNQQRLNQSTAENGLQESAAKIQNMKDQPRFIPVSEIMKTERQAKSPRPSVKSRLSMKKGADVKQEDVHSIKAIIQNDHIKPRQRIQWTDDMVLRLLVYYTILLHESRPKTIFIWKSIHARFENFGENRCKKQIESAKKDPFLISQMEWLKVKWEKLYADNFRNKHTDFDLDRFSELLLSKIDVKSWSKKGNADDMHLDSESNLARSTLAEREVEKWMADKSTSTAKLTYLLKFPFTCHLYNQEIDDFSTEDLSELGLKKDVAKATIKSILLTSEANYDPVVASAMLKLIEPCILDAAFTELNSCNILSKVKGGKDRQGPGRGYILSDRFLTSLSAGFPVGFITQARSFYQRLATSSPIPYSLSIGRGEMACILNEIPKQLITLTPLISLVDSDSLESSEYCFPFSISFSKSNRPKREIDSDSVVSTNPVESVKIKKIRQNQISNSPQLTKSQADLLSLIKEGGKFGYTKTALKKSLGSETLQSDLKSLEISHISKVGFNSIVYIDNIHLKHWQIQTQDGCFLPELWKDISGTTISIFLDTALENIISVIHKNPGIYLSKLVQFLPLTTFEVVKLLEILLNKGIIMKTCLPLNSGEISYYKLDHDWYKKH